MIRLFLFLYLFAGWQQAPADLSLLVTVTGIKQKQGYLMVELGDEKGKTVRTLKHDVKASGNMLAFAHLTPGKYTVSMFHDENADGKMNTGLFGIPLESYGFSNDARGTFGPPDLQEQLFELKTNKSISIHIK